MHSITRKLVVLSALLIPFLFFLGGSTGSGDSGLQAGGTGAVTFYVA